jgi:hypothetical protein
MQTVSHNFEPVLENESEEGRTDRSCEAIKISIGPSRSSLDSNPGSKENTQIK